MKLIALKDFVTQTKQMIDDGIISASEGMIKCCHYISFLNQPLTLGMFVPCDEDGNLLDNASFQDMSKSNADMMEQMRIYQQAKERVLFENDKHFKGLSEFNYWKNILNDYSDIESIAGMNLTLTKSALKQINLWLGGLTMVLKQKKRQIHLL